MTEELDRFVKEDSRGNYRVIHLGNGVVWFQFEGRVTADCWPPSERLLESVIARHGTVLMLGNGSSWENYESGYRVTCTRWFLARRSVISAVHLLVRSTIIKMGVGVVNLAIPIINGYTDPKKFMAAATEGCPDLLARLRREGLAIPV